MTATLLSPEPKSWAPRYRCNRPTGRIQCRCVSALLMASLDNGMSLKNVADYIQDIVKGGILVIAVALDMLGRKRST